VRRWWHGPQIGGCDGVMVPIITDAEKIKRRDKVKAKRRRRGKKCKPLPPRRRGSDLPWKEFKVAFFYSEDAKHQQLPEGKTWADDLMHVFKHEGYSAGWERILPWRTALRGTAKRKAADRLLHFISARRDMIRYPEFRERGWQIGSGPTESQCKLCTKRLKGYGRRWDRPNATAVAALDSLDRNGQWRQVWPNARYATT
jgi:hypothetical protein